MLKRADEFIIYDSTAYHRGCRVFAQFNSGNLCKTASAMPEWVTNVSGNCRTFVRNHAQSIVACDFLVVVSARFRTLYVFLLMVPIGTKFICCTGSESSNYGVLLSDNDAYIKVKRMVYLSGQTSKLDGIIAQHSRCVSILRSWRHWCQVRMIYGQ